MSEIKKETKTKPRAKNAKDLKDLDNFAKNVSKYSAKKKKKNSRKVNQNQGRPSVLTTQVVGKLIEAFEGGMNVSVACRIAGISRDVYYDAVKRDEWFCDKMEAAQENLSRISREVIASKIKSGDDFNSRWWLERKNREEFSARREISGKIGISSAQENEEISDEEINEAIFGK